MRNMLRLLILIAWPLCVAAAENPFELPAPRDPKAPGSIMLHGGGRGLGDEVRREFVRLAGGRSARIVLLPSDQSERGKDDDGNSRPQHESMAAHLRRLREPREYGAWHAFGERGEVADFQFLIPDPENDPEEKQFYELLENATGDWLPAYDQVWLAQQFASEYPKQTSRFQLALREVVARGGVVGGLGGGMSALGETMIASDGLETDGWKRAELKFGLALFSGAVVDQNFTSRSGRLERLSDLLRKGPALDRHGGQPGVERRTIGLGVERATVMILCENTIRVLGEGRGHVFLKSNGDRTLSWRTLAPGDEPLVLTSDSRREPSAANVLGAALNPFGFPEPIDPAKPGTVVLHGGGSTREMLTLFPKLAAASPPRMVHCPAARESCRPALGNEGAVLAEHLEKTFDVWRALETDGRVSALSFLTTSTPADANRAEFIEPLTRADGLWFCGGDQAPLAKLFVDPLRPTLFQHEVFNILRRGGAVGGSSAGLAIMADVMIEGDVSEDGRPAAAELSRGLGVLKQVLAEQHFDARSGRIERLTGLLRDHKRLANFSPTSRPKQMIALAVEEDTALIVQANRLQVSGKKLAHVFLQDDDPRLVIWHALKPGDVAVMLPEKKGYVLELEDWRFGE